MWLNIKAKNNIFKNVSFLNTSSIIIIMYCLLIICLIDISKNIISEIILLIMCWGIDTFNVCKNIIESEKNTELIRRNLPYAQIIGGISAFAAFIIASSLYYSQNAYYTKTMKEQEQTSFQQKNIAEMQKDYYTKQIILLEKQLKTHQSLASQQLRLQQQQFEQRLYITKKQHMPLLFANMDNNKIILNIYNYGDLIQDVTISGEILLAIEDYNDTYIFPLDENNYLISMENKAKGHIASIQLKYEPETKAYRDNPEYYLFHNHNNPNPPINNIKHNKSPQLTSQITTTTGDGDSSYNLPEFFLAMKEAGFTTDKRIFIIRSINITYYDIFNERHNDIYVYIVKGWFLSPNDNGILIKLSPEGKEILKNINSFWQGHYTIGSLFFNLGLVDENLLLEILLTGKNNKTASSIPSNTFYKLFMDMDY